MSETGDVKKKRGCGFWILVALGIFIGLGVIGAIFGPSEEEMKKIQAERDVKEKAEGQVKAKEASEKAQAERDSALKITARQLFSAYESNEARAQKELGGRLLEVTGTIDRIDLDISDNPTLWLNTGEMFQSVNVGNSDSISEHAEELDKGQKITLLCHDVSEIAGIPMLKDCTLLK